MTKSLTKDLLVDSHGPLASLHATSSVLCEVNKWPSKNIFFTRTLSPLLESLYKRLVNQKWNNAGEPTPVSQVRSMCMYQTDSGKQCVFHQWENSYKLRWVNAGLWAQLSLIRSTCGIHIIIFITVQLTFRMISYWQLLHMLERATY